MFAVDEVLDAFDGRTKVVNGARIGVAGRDLFATFADHVDVDGESMSDEAHVIQQGARLWQRC